MTKIENILTLKAAIEILKQYSCIQLKTVDSEEEKQQLRQALIRVVMASEYENLGICADNSQQAFVTLTSYLKALGYKSNFDLGTANRGDTPIYLKFNTQKMSYYTDKYVGDYRGVLISFYAHEEEVVGTYGHFPLDLFV